MIVHHADIKSLPDRYYSSVCEVMNINPDIVLDMCAKHSFLSAELYKHFPVICVSTGHNCNASLFHKYVCRGIELCKEVNAEYKSVEVSQMVELPVGTVFPTAKYEYKREDYGLPNDAFIVVVVGRRLDKDINIELSRKLVRLLDEVPNMVLLLVGDGVGMFTKEYPKYIEDHRIVLWGYEDDLPSLYRICDVFFNPDRTGGGWSITWAIGEGLPVLSTDYPNDCSPLLGDMVVKDGYDGIMREIKKMVSDKKCYEEWVVKTQERKMECSFDSKIKKLIQLCDEMSDC